MIEFSKYKLGDICNIVAGGDAPKEVSPIKTNEFDIPIYSNGIEKEGLYGYTKTPRITEKAVTLSARGTIGIPFNRKTPYYPIVRLISLTSKVDNLNIDYLYYALKQFKYSKDGSVQQQLTVPMISEKTIHLPDLSTQKKIAYVLSCIDDKIALNNKTNNELESMAKTVYDYWFTQFDFPDANGKPYKASGGKMEYNQVLKREIPAGWEVGKLGDMAIFSSKTTTTNKIENYITTDNILPNKQGVIEAEYIPTYGSVLVYERNDILIANIRPYFKKIWLANKSGMCSNDVLCIKSRQKNFGIFLYRLLWRDDFF